jgi:hypothetical protein
MADRSAGWTKRALEREAKERADSLAKMSPEELQKLSDSDRLILLLECLHRVEVLSKGEQRKGLYAYKVVKIERDLRFDSKVVAEAEVVINQYARQGWRLHSYSQESLGDNVGRGHSNVLHLVFEKLG